MNAWTIPVCVGVKYTMYGTDYYCQNLQQKQRENMFYSHTDQPTDRFLVANYEMLS
jgi:hypothetical protein